MKYLSYIFIALIAGLLIYFGFFDSKPQPNENPKTEQSTDASQGQWETKIDNQPPITVKVTPIEFGKNVRLWKFAVAFDTHSGSLDQDLRQVAMLLDDKGNVYWPIAWEGPEPGGHHREGVLVFNPVELSPKYVELKIKNIGGVVERLFRWNLE